MTHPRVLEFITDEAGPEVGDEVRRIATTLFYRHAYPKNNSLSYVNTSDQTEYELRIWRRIHI
jgi:hypothetical protein